MGPVAEVAKVAAGWLLLSLLLPLPPSLSMLSSKSASVPFPFCYGSTGPSGYRGSRTSRMTGFEGSGVLGRVGPSVNSGALMSVVEVQGFWKDQLVIDC